MLLKNCKIIENDDEVVKDILIEEGRIKNINENIDYGGRVIDVGGKHVLPGLIDPHVHFRDCELAYKEDYLTGSMAAAAGGVTTILDMPNTIPATTTVALLNEKRKLAEKSVVNYGFHFAAAIDNIEEIKKAQELGCAASVKLFMNLSTGKLMIDDDEKLKEIFENSRLIAVHVEGDKVKQAYELIKNTNNKLYYCHISSKREIDFIKTIKSLKNSKNFLGHKKSQSDFFVSSNIYVEATPHHLFLTEEDDNSNFTKMKPSLKTKEDQEALWNAIENGLVDTIGSDHAPHTIEEKKKEIIYGVPGVETTLPLLLDAYNKNKISLKKIIELTAENPAKIFGIRNKGKIKKGYDADLVVVDLELEKEVRNENLFTKCGWSPFNGLKLKGWPIMTIVNGNIVFENRKINDIKGMEVSFNERKTSG